ncbi:MAG: NYN domain-containing protein [Anaerolineales bacterium]|nr:NYN domain-containing protein [Anaerolineales bacterium]
MLYLIDGHNLIAKLPDIELTDPNDEVKLVLKLRGWAAIRRQRKIILYFDGGLPGGRERNLSTPDVQVTFATHGKTADHLLIQRIKRITNPAEYILVTSDQQIIKAAQARKMKFWRSETFVKRLLQEQSERQVKSPQVEDLETAVDPAISAAEIAEYLEMFGPVPEPAPKQSSQKPISPPKSAAQNTKKKTPSADELKSGADKITPDDLDAWLQLFGYSD